MKQVLVTRAQTYATKQGGGTIAGINEIHLLATGAVAFFTEENELITAANAATIDADRKKFYIAVGNALDASKTLISNMIPRRGTNVKKLVYAAPTKCVKYVGYDGTTAGTSLNMSAPVVGNDAILKIIDTTNPFLIPASKMYSYTVKTGDTATTIANALIALVNANVDSAVVAAAVGSTTGISLTAKSYGQSFAVSVNGELVNATIVEAEGATTGVAVAPVLGEGTSDQILALEDLAMTERGKTNRSWLTNVWSSQHSLVLSGSTYQQYVFRYRADAEVSHTELAKKAVQEVILACEMTGSATDGDGTGGTVVQTQTINTIMTALFANVGTAAQAEETGA